VTQITACPGAPPHVDVSTGLAQPLFRRRFGTAVGGWKEDL
jgi:hypothetical protein